jgi:hypothetical protein
MEYRCRDLRLAAEIALRGAIVAGPASSAFVREMFSKLNTQNAKNKHQRSH